MDRLIYISVYKLEDEAIKAIEKLHAQGFRKDQISVLAYNTERFNTLFKPLVSESAVEDAVNEAVNEDIPKAVEKALAPDVVVPLAAPGTVTDQQPGHAPGYTPLASLAGLKLAEETHLSHERSLQDGDILVVLQTDKGQKYRPDLPLIKK